MQNVTRWYQELECPVSYEQIDLDLSNFPSIDMDLVAPEAISRFSDRGRHSLCHYKIVDNKVCHACAHAHLHTHTEAHTHTHTLTHTHTRTHMHTHTHIYSACVLTFPYLLNECLHTSIVMICMHCSSLEHNNFLLY